MLKRFLIFFIASLSLFFEIKLVANVSTTNKSFFLPRPPGRELFVDHSGWYKARRYADNAEDEQVGLSLQATAFYRQSVKKSRLGGYFGVANKSNLIFGSGAARVDVERTDIPSQNMIHNAFEYKKDLGANNVLQLNDDLTYQVATPPSAPIVQAHVRLEDLALYSSNKGHAPMVLSSGTPVKSIGTGPFTWANFGYLEYKNRFDDYSNDSKKAPSGEVSLEPSSRAFGAKIGFYANFPKVGFLKVNVPILVVQNDLGIKFSDSSNESFEQFLKGEYSVAYKPLGMTQSSFNDEEASGAGHPPEPAFSTTYMVYKEPAAGQANAQSALQFSKIYSGKKRTDFGLGDIDISFGQRVADAEPYDCAVFCSVVLPASDKPTGEFLFEPQRGNGHHFELGGGFEGTMDLLKFDAFSVEGFFNTTVRYIFKADETRTLDAFMDSKVRMPWQRYFLVGEKGKAGPLVPFSNVSTFEVEVKPGIVTEGFVGIDVQIGFLSLDLGYGFWAKEAEKIRIKSGDWVDDKYAFVSAFDYRTYEELDLDLMSPHTFGASNNTTILANEFDLSSAAMPAQITQTVWISGTYILESDYFPLAFTLGGNYEFGQDATSMTNYMIWGKASLSF